MHKKTAQAIAKTTSEVIGYGVLVTDERGIIIGCNNDVNRDLHELLLKQRDPQGLLKGGTHKGMQVGDFFSAPASTQIGVHGQTTDRKSVV